MSEIKKNPQMDFQHVKIMFVILNFFNVDNIILSKKNSLLKFAHLLISKKDFCYLGKTENKKATDADVLRLLFAWFTFVSDHRQKNYSCIYSKSTNMPLQQICKTDVRNYKCSSEISAGCCSFQVLNKTYG